MNFLEFLDFFLESVFKKFFNLGQFLLRLFLGIAFILHGVSKFPLPPQKLMDFFNFSPEFASFIAISEITAGALLIVSFFIRNYFGNLLTRLSSLIIVTIMICALLLAHKDWLINQKLFMSEQIFLLVIGFYFLIVGNKSINK